MEIQQQVQQQLGMNMSCSAEDLKGLAATPHRQTSYQEPPNTPLHIKIETDVDQAPVS